METSLGKGGKYTAILSLVYRRIEFRAKNIGDGQASGARRQVPRWAVTASLRLEPSSWSTILRPAARFTAICAPSDSFINPLVYTFWSECGPSIMTMSSALAE
jgi:hypothetical protein